MLTTQTTKPVLHYIQQKFTVPKLIVGDFNFYCAMHMHKQGICRHPVSVCLSVCLSVRHVRELRQNE